MIKFISLIALVAPVLVACGGGGDSTPAPIQLYSCSGMVLPGTNLVGGACVPIVSSSTTTSYEANRNNCCQEAFYDPLRQRYSYTPIQIGDSSSKGMVCELNRAYFSCSK